MSKSEWQHRYTEEAISEKKELMHEEIDKKLNEELQKPAEQVDGRKVDEYLDQLCDSVPKDKEKEALWAKIQEERKREHNRKVRILFLRCAACVVIAVFLFAATFHTAKAFRWTFLLKYLNPVAQTFGIYTEDNLNNREKNASGEAYTDSETGIEQTLYIHLADMPAIVDYYPVVPGYVPQGYTFVQGTVYQDADVSNVSLTYQHDEEYLMFTIVIYQHEDIVAGYEFEKTAQQDAPGITNDQYVTQYYNQQGEICSVSWIQQNAHYNVYGRLEAAEISKIIQSFQ